jgi:putative toxin-antitoxin system antitoxin component (TIGR02293 family)
MMDALTYAAILGVRVTDPNKLVDRINAGFSYRSYERLMKELQLTNSELAKLVQISTRTLARRKSQGKLLPDESERLLRISRVYDQAVRFFEEDKIAARGWLKSSARGLRNRTPLEYAKTEVGAREVERLIGRMEYGVFS